VWSGRHVLSGCPFLGCTSSRKEDGLAAVLVLVVQKLGYGNVKLSNDSPGQALSAPGV